MHTTNTFRHSQPHRALGLALLACYLLLLTGCITPKAIQTPPSPPPKKIDWVGHVKELTLLKDWQLQGKIGVKQQNEGGSAYINWTQSDDSFHIILSGPLGQGTTIISGNDDGAKLESASNGTYIAESPEELLYRHTGWHIPIHNLLYWIKGLPEPRLPSNSVFNEHGYIRNLSQGPWQLTFYRYEKALGVTLPHKVKIQNQDLKVTLIIKHWANLNDS